MNIFCFSQCNLYLWKLGVNMSERYEIILPNFFLWMLQNLIYIVLCLFEFSLFILFGLSSQVFKIFKFNLANKFLNTKILWNFDTSIIFPVYFKTWKGHTFIITTIKRRISSSIKITIQTFLLNLHMNVFMWKRWDYHNKVENSL